MTRSIAFLMAVLVAVSACGIRRPLIRPAEIPEYERQRAEKMKKFDAPEAQQAPATLQNSQPGGASLQEMMTPMPQVEQ